MSMDTGEVVRSVIAAGETILWDGRPAQGVRLQPSDVVVVPFSILWGGFAFFWEGTVINSNGPLFFRLWGIPFVLVGIYLMIGRFFWDAYTRSQTYYAVTNERVLIIRRGVGGSILSLPLKTLPAISVAGSQQRGTVTLGPEQSSWSGGAGWPGSKEAVPALVGIDDALRVSEVIRRAQREAS